MEKKTLKTIKITKTNNPEYGYENKEELLTETKQHIQDVGGVMTMLGYELADRGGKHDWTKLEYFPQFAQDTLERLTTPEFKARDWYKIHTVKERHHINANVPENVNLIDILEMIVDCVVAGKTRSGHVDKKFLEIPNTILEDAYWNTVELIEDTVIIDE